VPAFILTAIMLSLIGPAGIMPRCAIVSYGGVESMFPAFPLWIFSAIFCLMITALVWNKSKIVDIIGVYLTPLKLGSFILLIVIGLVLATRILDAGPDITTTFTLGLKRGYQTMDLVASFFFGSTIYHYIRHHLTDADDSVNDPALDRQILSLGFKASLVGGALLSLCYVGFVLLGAKYAHLLAGVPKEALLMEISKDTIGQYAVPFVAVTLLVTCLATSTIVAALFADFLQADVLRNKISRKAAIIITMVITYAISLLGFEGICAMLGAILEWVYPFLMVFALYMMIRYKLRSR
jgi:LIVCS family branched-chain amino acid:cation transporter